MKKITTLILFLTFTTTAHSFIVDECETLELEGNLKARDLYNLNRQNKVVMHESLKKLDRKERNELLTEFYKQLCKAPREHRKIVAARGIETHLTAGSIGQHPMIAALTGLPRNHTMNWDELPGVAGTAKDVPTVINVKSLYAGHGSANLVLHEFAHVLDRFFHSYEILNLDLTPMESFQNIYAVTPWEAIYHEALVPYHKENADEHFAELYAHWYGSEESRAKVHANIPELQAFFDALKK